METFTAQFKGQPHRNRTFTVRGVCEYDVLNPCWDNRKSDIPGQHWGGGKACKPCTITANNTTSKQSV